MDSVKPLFWSLMFWCFRCQSSPSDSRESIQTSSVQKLRPKCNDLIRKQLININHQPQSTLPKTTTTGENTREYSLRVIEWWRARISLVRCSAAGAVALNYVVVWFGQPRVGGQLIHGLVCSQWWTWTISQILNTILSTYASAAVHSIKTEPRGAGIAIPFAPYIEYVRGRILEFYLLTCEKIVFPLPNFFLMENKTDPFARFLTRTWWTQSLFLCVLFQTNQVLSYVAVIVNKRESLVPFCAHCSNQVQKKVSTSHMLAKRRQNLQN